MSTHKTRMSYISRFAPPPEGTLEAQTWGEFIGSLPHSPDLDKELRKRFKRANAIIQAQLANGASFKLDELLRDFLLEYNGRNMQHGLRSMPASFNVMEAFYEYVPELSVFRLLPEKDYLFSSVEFLDYVTSREASDDIKDVLETLEERVIHSYNVLNDVGEITFRIPSGRKYGIGGVSLVRHSSEISLLLLSGEQTDVSEQTRKLLADFRPVEPFPGRESLKPAEDRIREAVPLLGNDQFWQTMVLSRIDLEHMTVDVRYIMQDIGDGYLIKSDDIEVFLNVTKDGFIERYEEAFKQSMQEIQDYDTLFELCKTCLYLPLFFENHADDISVENHPTQLFNLIKKRGSPKTKPKYIGPKEKITHRMVSVIRMPVYQHPNRTFHTAPALKVEVSGFWKRLDPIQVGTDKHGQPIHGRTWVEKTLSWAQSESNPGPLIAERHIRQTSHSPQGSTTSDRGYIYVLRSAAHAKDIFKIGLSRRSAEIRAQELSQCTASPDKFLTVQEWEVSDCAKAEALIHQALDKYRINPDREFFKAPYREIAEAIEEVLFKIDIGHNHGQDM